jgi:hypothetical protein
MSEKENTYFQRIVKDYETRVLPLRDDADSNDDYREYDDEFNILLEDCFDAVRGQAKLLDAAPRLLEALRECFSDPGCYAFASDDFYKAKQRLLAINNIVRGAIEEATGEQIK